MPIRKETQMTTMEAIGGVAKNVGWMLIAYGASRYIENGLCMLGKSIIEAARWIKAKP
jgi:hypothetical protein